MEQSEPSTFGILLRRYRVAAGLTQEELGERAQISARTVSDVERGIARRPQSHTALQLADALGLNGETRQSFLNAARGLAQSSSDGRLPVRTAAPAPIPDSTGKLIPFEPISLIAPGEEAPRAKIAPRARSLSCPRPRTIVRRIGSRGLVLPLAVIAALAAAVVVLLGVRVLGFGSGVTVASTAVQPVVIGSIGTRTTGPFPLPHMWNIHVLPDGRVAVIDYSGSFVHTAYEGVAELSPSGQLLWSWSTKDSGFGGLSSVASDAAGDLYAAARLKKAVYKLSPDGRLLTRWSSDKGFKGPTRVAVDRDGNVWIVDFDSARILKFSPSGRPLASYGSNGSGVGQFAQPNGVAVSLHGNIYISDLDRGRITELSPNGTPIRAFGADQLSSSRGLTTDAAGNVLVADTGMGRIEKYSPDGRFLGSLGKNGSGPGQFLYPVGVSVGPHGNIYVADDASSLYCGCGPDRIEVLAPSGKFLYQWTDSVLQHTILASVAGLAVDARGNVYATDVGTNRVVAFGPNHLPQANWGRKGTGSSSPWSPNGITIDNAGSLLVADTLNNGVQRFTAVGKLKQSWQSIGGQLGQYSHPQNVAVDSSGHVFLSDTLADRVEELSAGGKLVRTWTASFGSGSAGPYGAIAADGRGAVCVGNETSMTVDKYTSTGKYLGSIGGLGPNGGSLLSISGLAVDPGGRVYVVDSKQKALVILSPSGTVIARWTASRFPRLGDPRAVALDRSGNIYVGGGQQIVEIAALS